VSMGQQTGQHTRIGKMVHTCGEGLRRGLTRQPWETQGSQLQVASWLFEPCREYPVRWDLWKCGAKSLVLNSAKAVIFMPCTGSTWTAQP
jgi:hypothetical protein